MPSLHRDVLCVLPLSVLLSQGPFLLSCLPPGAGVAGPGSGKGKELAPGDLLFELPDLLRCSAELSCSDVLAVELGVMKRGVWDLGS